MAKKVDNIEKDKRLRIIQEWLIDDWPSADIKLQIVQKWSLSVRQAERYIEQARERWNKEEDEKLDRKRNKMIESLKKDLRSMKPEYACTPSGINAKLRIRKEISRLENLYPSKDPEQSVNNGVDLIIIE